jgi:endo-1,4-beta-xylanase
LKNAASFPLGVAISYYLTRNDANYGKIITTHFNRVTFEYQMKHVANVRNDGSFNFVHTDHLVNKIIAAGLAIHGHALVWHRDNNNHYLHSMSPLQVLPDPKFSDKVMKDWIETVVSRYAGKVTGWDVANEPFDQLGHLRTGYRDNGFFSWFDVLGRSYLANAFHYAHVADPKAILFMNEYDLEAKEAKLDALLHLVYELKKQQVPIHGIGTQMHIYANTPDRNIDEMFIKLAQTGLQIHVSELDVRMNLCFTKGFVPTTKLLECQADRFSYVVQSYRKHVPVHQQYGITAWNVTDNDSWVSDECGYPDYPTMFDKEFNRKPAFDRFLWSLRNF